MAKKLPTEESSENTLPIEASTTENTENSELSNTGTEDSNIRAVSSSSLLDSKMNAKDTTTTATAITATATTAKTMKETKLDGFRARLEEFNRQSKQNKQSKSIKSGPKQRVFKGLKSNLSRQVRSSKSTVSPRQHSQRNSLGELIDMIIQFNINTPTTSPNRQRPANLGMNASNFNPINDAVSRQARRVFGYQPTSPTISSSSSNFNTAQPSSQTANSNLSAREIPINTLSPLYMTRMDPIEFRILHIFEQLLGLIDRFLVILGDFREEINELQNRDLAVSRMVSSENNSQLMEAITNTLPERLAELFGREIEKSLNKFFGDKKKN